MVQDTNSAGQHQSLEIVSRLHAIMSQIEQNVQRSKSLQENISSGHAHALDQRDLLRKSIIARMHARLESQPTIEQAKGILMAQTGCDADQAFDVLRRASQRTNVTVRALAADIVARTVSAHRPTAPPIPTMKHAVKPVTARPTAGSSAVAARTGTPQS